MSVNTARGMRDYLPSQARRRRALIEIVTGVFERYGFEPLGTPAVERLETLTGKYGEEGEQLLFRILERGAGAAEGACDLGLRYDLTVPLARVVAQHGASLPTPFRRYQIEPVWRADRPQKGRFREFVQCDVDVVGADSLAADAELVAVAHDCFQALGLGDYTLRLNHRGALRALVEVFFGADASESDALIALDKLDKVGPAGVQAELVQRGFPEGAVQRLAAWLQTHADGADGLELLRAAVGAHPEGAAAIAALDELVVRVGEYGVPVERWCVDPTLARGLSYYTGPVFEATLPEFSGSVAGGGRYDGLVGMFSGRAVPATGLSLGFERLLVVLEQREQELAGGVDAPADVAVLPFGEGERAAAIAVAQRLRHAGLRVLTPTESRKLAKALKAISARGIPTAVVLGSEEVVAEVGQLKDLRSGEQRAVSLTELPAAIRALLRPRGG